jgi:hypothetical protein
MSASREVRRFVREDGPVIEMELLDPGTGRPLGMFLEVAGEGHPARQSAFRGDWILGWYSIDATTLAKRPGIALDGDEPLMPYSRENVARLFALGT